MVLAKAVTAGGIELDLEVWSLDGSRRARAAAFSEVQPAGAGLGARQRNGNSRAASAKCPIGTSNYLSWQRN